ncbi:hypothetical protein [Enterococcus faecalis]|uniref:hypothetical protein n=1 Tax=Enterococcus TaxID=1350 RepID=UPI000E08047A|nr:hypothetical protein [Enterococcus faecalis]RBS10903.1 hypothetical protein EA85_01006 [Enterococcus faecalis]
MMNFLRWIFVDNDGNFQWMSITALISAGGVWATFNRSKKTIQANVHTKTEIEKLNQIRDLVAEIISDGEMATTYSRFAFGDKVLIESTNSQISNIKQVHQTKNENLIKYNDFAQRVMYSSNKLLLYFTDEEKYSRLINLINQLQVSLVEISDYSRINIEPFKEKEYYENIVQTEHELSEKISNILVDLRKETTVYLQGKWKIIDSVK